MSATLDGARVAALLEGAPVVDVPGRQFPVEVVYAGRGAPLLPGGVDSPERMVAQVVRRALEESSGDLLVFLPGAGEIRRVQLLARRSRRPAPVAVAVVRRPRCQGTGCGAESCRGRRAAHRARDQHCRDQRDDSGRDGRRRCRACAAFAFRSGDRHEPPGSVAHFARGRRPARRSCGPHRAGPLLSFVERGLARKSRRVHARRNH